MTEGSWIQIPAVEIIFQAHFFLFGSNCGTKEMMENLEMVHKPPSTANVRVESSFITKDELQVCQQIRTKVQNKNKLNFVKGSEKN